MSKLVLHIGSHKTGSTYIQKFLAVNNEELESRGVRVFSKDTFGGDKAGGNLNCWFDHSALKNSGVHIVDGLVEALAESKSKEIGTVIASSEIFSWIFDPTIINKLSKLFDFFDDIKVVCFLRRQDKLALSHYQQRIRTKAERSFFSGNNKALPKYQKHYDHYYDYNNRIGFWAAAFGHQNLEIRLFDDKNQGYSNILSEFSEILNLDLYGLEIPQKNNVNIGWEKQKIGHLLLELGIEPRSELGQLILRSIKSNGKMMPSYEEAESFYNRYRESNKKLNDSFNISESQYLFDDDFSMYELEPKDVWDEARANSVVIDLINIIKRKIK